MCGLVGIAGDLQTKDELLMKKLLVLDYFRGVDSTGLAAIRDSNEVKMAKAAVSPLDLFDMGRFKEALSGYNSKVFLGHNRAATRGMVNNFNAHPFQFGSIVGAHNGTLEHSSHKALEEMLGEEDVLDSRLLIKAISVIGVKDTIENISGAWSLVWWDKEDDSLNFLRNKERPMWYAFTEDFKRIIWASEHPMIKAAIEIGGKNEFKLHTEKDTESSKVFAYFATSEDIHYKFSLSELKKGQKKPKPKAKEIKGKEKPPVIPYGNPYGCNSNVWPIQNANNDKGGSSKNTDPLAGTVTTTPPNVFGDGDTPQFLLTPFNDPFAGRISSDRFRELAMGGCSWCGKPVYYHDNVTIHDRTDSILCPDCSPFKKDGKTQLFLMNTQKKVDLILLENNAG